jgi:hypothetical protein
MICNYIVELYNSMEVQKCDKDVGIHTLCPGEGLAS